MSIQQIEINDFTVFKNIAICTASGVNIIIGENGTGKTHLLKLIYSVWLARKDLTYKANIIFGKKEKFHFSYAEEPVVPV